MARPPAHLRVSVAVAVVALAATVLGVAPGTSKAALSTGVVNVTTTLGYENGSAAGTGTVLTAPGEGLTNNYAIRGATTLRGADPRSGRSDAATCVGYSVRSGVA